jgi:SAM-dependent methyltransferase
MEQEEVRAAVRKGYAEVAKGGTPCCGPGTTCGGNDRASTIARAIGYTDAELRMVPDGANLGLGCGNPVALASLKDGDVVLDLGSGAGLDCFLASVKVGAKGKVIGVDMTPEMLDRARRAVRESRRTNIEFRLGEIENLPVADASVDVIISNCVINLSPDKPRVFRETFRVLKPGGRLAVSDITLLKELPTAVRDSIASYVGCISGAMLKDDYLQAIRSAGFADVTVTEETRFPVDLIASDATARALVAQLGMSPAELAAVVHSAVSVRVQATKPVK